MDPPAGTNKSYLSQMRTPPSVPCSEKQVYNGCLKPSRDLRTCRMFRQNHPEIEEATSPGCKCKEGFYLEKGVCIPESECPEYPGEYTGFDTDGDGRGDGPPPSRPSSGPSNDQCSLQEVSQAMETAGTIMASRFNDYPRLLDRVKTLLATQLQTNFYDRKWVRHGEKRSFECA